MWASCGSMTPPTVRVDTKPHAAAHIALPDAELTTQQGRGSDAEASH
jgi:hypothetical protein